MALNKTIQLSEDIKRTWDSAFDGNPTYKEIKAGSRRDATVHMLEMQLAEGNKTLKTKEALAEYSNALAEGRDSLNEDTVAGDMANWDPILISMVRRAAPSIVAHDLMGVQPMSGPTGLIFSMKATYGEDAQTGAEALGLDEPVSDFSTGKTVGTGGAFPELQHKQYVQGDGSSFKTTAELEKMGVKERATDNAGNAIADAALVLDSARVWPEMSFKIDKVNVNAEGRTLKARYTDELTDDLRAIHGLNARDELATILSTELSAEMNRESVAVIMDQAVIGCQGKKNTGYFDLDVDADGRWSIEKFKGLLLQINQEAHQIAKETRRGVGNVVVTSSNVVAALDMAGVIDRSIETGSMNVDGIGTTYAGVLNGRFKVFVDPYASVDYVIVGYKGSNVYDAGVYYCPYIPFTIHEATDSESYQKNIGFKTRYGLAVNPFIGDESGRVGAGTRGQNKFYRKFIVQNL